MRERKTERGKNLNEKSRGGGGRRGVRSGEKRERERRREREGRSEREE